MRVRQQLGVNFARVSRERGIASFLCLTSVTAALLTRRSGLAMIPAGPRFEVGGETCQAFHIRVTGPQLRHRTAPAGGGGAAAEQHRRTGSG